MKSSRIVPLTLTLVVITLIALAWEIHQNYRLETVWQDQGPSPDARKNPYHGAEQFLRAKGIQTRIASVLPEVMDRLETTDTLMLFYDHDVEYRVLRDTINDWVMRGGHLVITVHYLWDEETSASGDEFLDGLGVRQFLWHAPENERDPASVDDTAASPGDGEAPEMAEDADAEGADAEGADAEGADAEGADAETGLPEEGIDDASLQRVLRNLNEMQKKQNDPDVLCSVQYQTPLTSIPVMPSTLPLQIAFEPDYHIEDVSSTAHVPNPAKPVHMLEYRRGAGKITVLTDYFIFNDDNIGDYDHAFFLWWLVQESPRVWLIHDKDSDSLLSLIWETAPWLMVTGLLWLAAHLLRRGRRFGPARSEDHKVRRQWLEHVDASADFLWRSQQSGKLLAEARQHIHARFPGMLESGQIPVRLLNAAEQADIPQETLVRALTAQDIEDENEFVEIVRLLQHIRMSL
jgi:hypothetical protein